MKIVVTTVGASLFSNYQDKFGEDSNISSLKNELHKEWDDCKEERKRIKSSVIKWARSNQEASAEIKSILKIQKVVQDDIIVRLIATDTVLSRLAAEIILELVDGLKVGQYTINVEFNPTKNDVIKGLQVTDKKSFEKEGLVNLIDYLYSFVTSENYILNITGGYKALIPYLTIMGMIGNVPIYYIFEDTDELIRIPQAPLDINWSQFEKYAYLMEKLDRGITEGWEQIKRVEGFIDDFKECIWEENGMAELNALGKMFWERYRQFIILKIPKGSKLFSDSSGNRKRIEGAIKELYERLKSEIEANQINNREELLNHIINLGDKNDLRHGTNPSKNCFIFKYTNQEHDRIVYSPELNNGYLSLYIYDYVRGSFNHSEYIQDLKKKWSVGKKELEFITVTIRKN